MADLADDLLYGVEAIAKFTGLPVRRVYYLAENKLIPAFKVGDKKKAMWCSRKSSLERHIERLEAIPGGER